jgi:glutamine synthetase
MDSLATARIEALELLGATGRQALYTTVGAEQEYFLVDEQYYFERPTSTRRAARFRRQAARGHELDEHYFGSIPERVLAYMLEVEQELAKLGVPIKTRHNEVAPAQYEIAPIFENSNIGSDHQQLTMQILQNVARRYGLVCLLHEKPFAGVNGSGKHNNWSMGTDTGENLLDPGDTPARTRSSCSSAPRSSARSTSTRRCSAPRWPTSARTTASGPTRRRRRSCRSSSAPSSRTPSSAWSPARASRPSPVS